jgi:RNA polymerase sigma-70 factor (ECF subfamily)
VLNIARSRAIDQLRRRIPEPREPAGAIALLDREGGDDAGTDSLLEQWRVAALLERLPAEEAAMRRFRFHHGLSQSVIAERSGIPLGTVKMRMAQGLDRLRGLIEAEGGAA